MLSFWSMPGTAFRSRSDPEPRMHLPERRNRRVPRMAAGIAGATRRMTWTLPNLDLGLIGNCSVSALIDRQGQIVWCCLPRFDGDPVFHALLGAPKSAPDDGVFSIEIQKHIGGSQAYVDNTAILKTTL